MLSSVKELFENVDVSDMTLVNKLLYKQL